MNLTLPKHWGSNVQGQIRSTPADFVVEEVSQFDFTGDGEHIWLKVRKTQANTDWVAEQLAHSAGIAKNQVSFAGLKDRHAVTTQWFSLHIPGNKDPEILSQTPDIEILERTRHIKKLKRGALTGNRFKLTLRHCTGDLSSLLAIGQQIRTQGVPNYFGEQRFGHQMRNIDKAKYWFSSGRAPKQRNLRSIYLSAARSWLFNQVLAKRVEDQSWNTSQLGEVYLLAGSNSCFLAEPDAQIQQRLSQGDIHLSGPLWGRGDLISQNTVQHLEADIAAAHSDLAQGLENQGLKQERRALRVLPQDFSLDILDAQTAHICMQLPPGCYATSVLRELGVFTSSA